MYIRILPQINTHVYSYTYIHTADMPTCIHVYMYMYTCTRPQMPTCTRIYTHLSIPQDMCIYVYILAVDVYMYTCIRIYTLYIHTSINPSIHLKKVTQTYTHTHAYNHTRTHTHKHTKITSGRKGSVTTCLACVLSCVCT